MYSFSGFLDLTGEIQISVYVFSNSYKNWRKNK